MPPHRHLLPSGIAVLIRPFGFWACFWLILLGFQHLPLSPLAGIKAFIGGGLAILAILLLVLGFLRIDGGTLYDVGLKFSARSFLQFVLGASLGITVAGIMTSALILLTPLEIEATVDSNILTVLGTSFLILFFLALMEEIAFRSYPLFRLREAWGIRPAIYISSIAFAFYHGIAFDNLLGPGVWGLFFGWMSISTRSIALPTGFHFGLNYLQALVGMKPQYSSSIWELTTGPGSALVGLETLGTLMQLLLLVTGILIIENFIRKQGS